MTNEKITTSSETSTNWDSLQPSKGEVTFPEEALKQDFDERFDVNPAEFPAFNRHAVNGWNIERTLSTYVSLTGELISKIDGTTNATANSENYDKTDCVVYLDKSARPVSWLVNTFWDTFSKEKRPESKYLLIDREDWFQYSNTDVDSGGYIRGTNELARGSDFKKNMDNLPPETYARIRSLFIPGGIKNEDPDEIMATPTGLEGKNLLVVDEVGHSGSTIEIARLLLQKALPEAKAIQTAYFWTEKGPNGEMTVPLWYESGISEGRGIGEKNSKFFEERHKKFNTDITRAQSFGSVVLGSYVDLGNENASYYYSKNPSRELASEIKKMKDAFLAGKVPFIPSRPSEYGIGRTKEWLDRQNISVERPTGNAPSPGTLRYIKQNILKKD